MVGKTNRLGLVAALIVLLAVLMPLSALAGSAAQSQMVKKQPVLADCAQIPDSELEHIRGRYDTYYFGLDVIVNLTGTSPLVSMTPNPNNTPGTVNTATGISYTDSNVTYRAGIAPQYLYQTVQVAGDGKIVKGVMNLDIMVPQSMLTGSRSGISLPKPSLAGLRSNF
jgi:hypothetical protein